MSNTKDTSTNLDSKPTLLSLPSSSWLFFLLKSDRLVLLSLLITSISYWFACYYQETTFITGSGTLITILGLLLTIKHGLLSSILNFRDTYNRYYGITHGLQLTGEDHLEPETANPVVVAIREEYVGILLTISGSLLNGFGTLIPLLSLCTGLV